MKRTRRATTKVSEQEEATTPVLAADETMETSDAPAAASASKYFTPLRAAASSSPVAAAAATVAVDEVDAAEEEAEADEEQPAKKKSKKEEKKLSTKPAAATGVSATPPSVRSSPAVLSFPDSLLSQPMESYSASFDTIARELLLNYELYSNGHWLRLLEIEMYWKGDEPAGGGASHHDLFVHAHPNQRNSFGRWYIHRQGHKPDASYKAGTYKGLDVTFGAAGGGGYGGILIRSVQRISDGAIIEGSCLVCEEVLRTQNADTIVDMVARWKGDVCAFTGPSLYFTPAQHRVAHKVGKPIMIKSPRVGLTLKQAGESRPQYLMQPYRYTMLPYFNKKMKQTIVLSAYEQLGAAGVAQLREICSCTGAYVDKLVASYESGKKLGTMEKFVKNNKAALGVDAMAQLFGAWMSVHGAKPYVAILKAE